MQINIKNVSINYIQYGSGKDILLLHGWGQNIEMMKMLGDPFSDRFRITILDLPGFGLSSEPSTDWSIGDYSDFLEEFINELEIKKPIIIGHSFGGRLAIRYSANHPVEKIVLFGSCARGTNNEDSDMDIAALIKCERNEIYNYSDIFAQIGSDMMDKYQELVNIVGIPFKEFCEKKSWYPF